MLKPSPRLNALVAGCLARAQKLTGATVHAVAVLSNHFHLLASFDTVEQMSSFACHLKTNLSKEAGRLHDWEGPLFAGRYRSVPLSDEESVQLGRLKYLLSQGAKEGLVMSPRDWPGVHCANALLGEASIEGVWVDRTRLYAARQRDGQADEAEFSQVERLQLSPLPCLASRPESERRKVLRDMVEEIEAETLARHRLKGTAPVGVGSLVARDPHGRALHRLDKSPKPHFHASRHVYGSMMEAFRSFVVAYRGAAERLRAGDRGVSFPENCFPPGLPFVEPRPVEASPLECRARAVSDVSRRGS
ncbi:MAG: hypothetical protein AAGM22_17110 [Acidobacteriota bacterium]